MLAEPLTLKKLLLSERHDQLNIPFTILDFKKKVITAIAKNEFKKNSLINLSGYTIDKNERKIKKKQLGTPIVRKRNQLSYFV